MKKILLALFLLALISSCTKTPKELIIGDWIFESLRNPEGQLTHQSQWITQKMILRFTKDSTSMWLQDSISGKKTFAYKLTDDQKYIIFTVGNKSDTTTMIYLLNDTVLRIGDRNIKKESLLTCFRRVKM